MPFSKDFLDELSERNDIVDVVGSYVALTKRSGVNLFGLCPFHGEKTPSFAVNPERKIYHCFGCGKGGGVINFIMDIENLSFREAVEFLAKRAGMELPQDEYDPRQNRRERMYQLNRDAALFFRSQLMAPAGAPGRAYVEKRGIGAKMVTAFGLGYAPDGWQALTDAMSAKGYTRQELVEAGLARVGKNGGLYDYFRNRLMFPVVDLYKNVIGFSGRILSDGEPKYLNSPDTLVYSKSKSLFALNLAKKSKSGYILLAEGNIDVVSLHQAGFDSAVASLGTALTREQAQMIAKRAPQVIIAYDADSAGQKAAQRAISILQPLDLKIKVLQIPGAKDPDEYIRQKGAAAFRELIEGSANQIEYRLEQTAAQFDLKTDEGRLNYLRAASKLIASLPGSVEREIYGARAAEKASVSPDAFLTEVARQRKLNAASARKKEAREASAPLRGAQPKSRELRFENVPSAIAEKGVLGLLCRFPELYGQAALTAADFTSPALGRMYEAVLEQARQGRGVSLDAMSEQFSSDELALLAEIIQRDDMPAAAAGQAMDDYIKKIRAEKERSARGEDLRAYAQKLKKTKGYGS